MATIDGSGSESDSDSSRPRELPQHLGVELSQERSDLSSTSHDSASSDGIADHEVVGGSASIEEHSPLHEISDESIRNEMERFYKKMRRRIDKLMGKLNEQQLVLYDTQHEILKLRMEIVMTMMEFESESKLITTEYDRARKGDIEESLNASWPTMMDAGGSVLLGNNLHSSWPSLRTDAILTTGDERPSWPSLQDSRNVGQAFFEIRSVLEELDNSSSDGSRNSAQHTDDSEEVSLATSSDSIQYEMEKLLFGIHTIEEEQSIETSTDSDSPNTPPSTPTETIADRQITSSLGHVTELHANMPISSGRYHVEPEDGRIRLTTKLMTNNNAMAESIEDLKAATNQQSLPGTSSVVDQALDSIAGRKSP